MLGLPALSPAELQKVAKGYNSIFFSKGPWRAQATQP